MERKTSHSRIDGAVYRTVTGSGPVYLGGPDRLDFLQRQTTNDLRELTPERALVTVLTSPVARIVDMLTVLQEPEQLALLAEPGRAAAVAAFLRGKVFFMDQVTITDGTGAASEIRLDGAGAASTLSAVGVEAPPGVGGVCEALMGDAAVRVVGVKGLTSAGYRLLVPSESLATVAERLDAAGAVALPAEMYEVLRVEAGLPGVGAELTGDFTPLEVGLLDAVSLSKGCYTGQEVIARQINYDKVTRHLAGVELGGPAAPGSEVRAEGRPVGALTSVVESPAHGWIGLAVLKRPYHEPGTQVAIRTGGPEVAAVVRALPFRGA